MVRSTNEKVAIVESFIIQGETHSRQERAAGPQSLGVGEREGSNWMDVT